MNDSTPVLHAQTLVKAYEEGNNELEVLKGVDPVSYTHLTLPTNREV